MTIALKEGEGMEDGVYLALTRREVLLLDLCLEFVTWDYATKGGSSSGVEQLRERLVNEYRQNE